MIFLKKVANKIKNIFIFDIIYSLYLFINAIHFYNQCLISILYEYFISTRLLK